MIPGLQRGGSVRYQIIWPSNGILEDREEFFSPLHVLISGELPRRTELRWRGGGRPGRCWAVRSRPGRWWGCWWSATWARWSSTSEAATPTSCLSSSSQVWSSFLIFDSHWLIFINCVSPLCGRWREEGGVRDINKWLGLSWLWQLSLEADSLLSSLLPPPTLSPDDCPVLSENTTSDHYFLGLNSEPGTDFYCQFDFDYKTELNVWAWKRLLRLSYI